MSHFARNWKKYAVLGAGLVATHYGVDMEQAKAALDVLRTLIAQ